MTEHEQLRHANDNLRRSILGLRDTFGVPIAGSGEGERLLNNIGAYIDAKIAVREREILDALKVMVEESPERS